MYIFNTISDDALAFDFTRGLFSICIIYISTMSESKCNIKCKYVFSSIQNVYGVKAKRKI